MTSQRTRSRSPRAYVLRLPGGATQRVDSFIEQAPRRPGHQCFDIRDDRHRNNFMLDLENSILSEWDARQGVPQGPRRFEVEAWAALVKRNMFPHHSDVDWDEYCDWVRKGGGDEWFHEEDE